MSQFGGNCIHFLQASLCNRFVSVGVIVFEAKEWGVIEGKRERETEDKRERVCKELKLKGRKERRNTVQRERA